MILESILGSRISAITQSYLSRLLVVCQLYISFISVVYKPYFNWGVAAPLTYARQIIYLSTVLLHSAAGGVVVLPLKSHAEDWVFKPSLLGV